MPDLDGIIDAPLRGGQRGTVSEIKEFFGQTHKLNFDEVQKEFNDRLYEVLSLLSQSKPILNNFEIDSVTFSLGLNMDGKVAILGLGGVSAGAQAGFQVALIRKE